MMRHENFAGLSLSAALLLAGGCADDVFRCASTRQCQNNGDDGTCQPNGFCSFPDDACPSGLRYGAEAPDGLANVCVEPEDAAGNDGATTGCDGACPDSGEATTTTTTTTTNPGESSGGPGATTTTGTTEPATTSGGSDESGSDSSGEPNPCPQINDAFDDGMVDDLLWSVVDPSAVSEASGTLRLGIDPQAGGVAGVELPDLAFDDSTIRIDVVELSPLTEFPFRLVLDAGSGTLEVRINGSESISVRLDGDTLASVPVEDPMAGVSLEVVSTLGIVHVSAGPAGSNTLDLLPLGKLGLQYVAGNVRLSLLAGTPGVIGDAPPFTVHLDDFSYCAADR